MYWFRDASPLAVLPWLLLAVVWFAGGWLLATHAFRLDRRERPLVGFGLGLVCWLFFSNILGRWLDPAVAFTAAAFLTLLLALGLAWENRAFLLDWHDLKAVWAWALVGVMLVVFFTLIGKGLAIFDDRKNLSIIALMAAGDIPPHFYMNSAVYFSYHYGSQLLAASLVRLGGLLPWSAFDLGKGILWAYGVLLSALLGLRVIRRQWAGMATAFIFIFASGTRYLALLLPAATLAQLDRLVTLQGTSAALSYTFSQALPSGWVVAGGPPNYYPFAFLNGFGANYILSHAGTYTLSLIILMLVWIGSTTMKPGYAVAPLSILLAFWAVTWESSYVLFGIGTAGLVIVWLATRRDLRACGFTQVLAALAISAPLALFQGGTITELGRQLLAPASGAVQSGNALASAGFVLRFPPALMSAHLGELRLDSPLLLLLALFEVGPILLLAPWITIWAWKQARSGDWIYGVLAISAWVGFILPLFLAYAVDRDITRLTGYSISVWVLLFALMLWDRAAFPRRWMLAAGLAAAALMTAGGLVVGWAQLSAISQPVLGLDLDGMDARVAQAAWDRLEPGAEVFDPVQWRAVALTGRLTHATDKDYELLPEYASLLAAPTAEGLLSQGYRYVYLDDDWWRVIPEESHQSLQQACARVVAEATRKEHFRRLLDLQDCAGPSQ